MRTVEQGGPVIDRLWAARGVFTAWSPEPVIGRARPAGFDWLALQSNLVDLRGSITRVHAQGLKAVVWGVPPNVSPVDGADGYIVQIEQREQYLAALDVLPAVAGTRMPVAIVTTFGGSDSPELIEPLLPFTDTALVECYVQDDPIHADVARMMWQAGKYGWPLARPVIGLYGNGDLTAYPAPKLEDGYSVWLGEEMTDAMWQQVEQVNS